MTTKLTIILLSFVVIVVGVSVYLSAQIITPPAPTYTRVNKNSTGLVTNNDLNTNAVTTVDWDLILRDAKQTESFTYAGLTFDVPKNMKQQTIEGITYFTFPIDLPEGPYINFSTSLKTSSAVVADVKANLGQFENIVKESTEMIHRKSWRMIEQTTDFGINQVVWTIDATPTAKIMYTPMDNGVTTLFERMVHSATPI